MDDSLAIRLPLSIGELLIRRIGPDDFEDLREYWSNPESNRYNWGPYTDDQVVATIEAQGEVEVGGPGAALILAVVLDGKVIGDCQLTVTSPDDCQGEIGFTFNPQFTGRGLATRAVAAVLGFGFVQLGLHRIEATTDARNERSSRLMERAGMRREGHFIHSSNSNGEWVDDYVYALLDHEWHDRHPDLATVVPVEGDSQE
jgi:RimJ/RimL family protein N-acetyltransferase